MVPEADRPHVAPQSSSPSQSKSPTRYPDVEFREDTRTPLVLPVRIKVSDSAEVLARTGNISAGGLFVATRKAPPVGTQVKFVLDLGQKIARGYAEVVWLRVRSKSTEAPSGMGLQFRHFLDDSRQHLIHRLEEERRAQERRELFRR